MDIVGCAGGNETIQWMRQAYEDLQMDRLMRYFTAPGQGPLEDETLFGLWTEDRRVLDCRHEAVEALLAQPGLVRACGQAALAAQQAGEQLDAFGLDGYGASMRQLRCVALYVRGVDALRDAFEGQPRPGAEYLAALAQWADDVSGDPAYMDIKRQTEQIHRSLSPVSGLSLGFNLQAGSLYPTHILTLGHSAQPAPIKGLLEGGLDERAGFSHGTSYERGGYSAYLQNYVYDTLSRVNGHALRQLKPLLRRFDTQRVEELADFARQWRFYAVSLRMIDRLRERSGTIGRPNHDPAAWRMKGLYEIPLWMERAGGAVANDVTLGGFDLVTGGNQSGKTTLVRALGQAQWLYQCGFFLPGAASMRIVRGIQTMFSSGELEDKSDSRMGREAQRIGRIMEDMAQGGDYLVLMNEPLTSTSPSEAAQILLRLLKRFSRGCVPGVMATHYRELYSMALSEAVPEEYLGSLVMRGQEGGQDDQAFRAVREPPGSHSVRRIAQEYGMTFPQLSQRLADMDPGVQETVAALRAQEGGVVHADLAGF